MSVVPGAGTVLVNTNLIAETPRGAVVGLDHARPITADLTGEGAPHFTQVVVGNNAVDLTWLARPNAQLPRSQPQPERPLRLSSPPLRFSAELTTDETPSVAPSDATAFEPDLPALEIALDNASESAPPTIQDRYPLLRNAL